MRFGGIARLAAEKLEKSGYDQCGIVEGGTMAWAEAGRLYLACGFVGAGLAFAGITDWCGMGTLTAKLPWNQRGGGGSCCAK